MISITFVLGVTDSDVSRYHFWLIFFLDIPSQAVFNGTFNQKKLKKKDI